MDTTPVEKKSKIYGIDRISSMPDPILGKILSYLPTKSAVATRVLSTRWKSIFPFGDPPIKIDLDDSLLLHPGEHESRPPSASRSFVDFVDRLFNETLCNGPCIDKFVLKCKENYDDAKIVSWVRAAIKLKVKRLDLEFFLDDPETLFCCLNGCETLVGLELGRSFDLCIPQDFTIPNLKKLRLNYLDLADEDSDFINELLLGCPLIEDLWVESCNLRDLEVLSIESPLLKNLVIEDSWPGASCELVLDAPNIEVLLYCDSVASKYFVSNFRSLLAAHIDVGPNQEQMDDIDDYSDDEVLSVYDYGVAKLVSACSSTIHLYLAGCSLDALHRSEAQLAEFQNLTWLALGCLPVNGWVILARMLLSTPNLRKLTLEEGFKEYEGGYGEFESSLSSPPMCLQLHLKKVELWVFKGEEDEFKLIDYFLKNGVLQKLKIDNVLPCEDLALFQRLITLEDPSQTCRILLGKKTRTDG